eukprot:gene10948-14700_t
MLIIHNYDYIYKNNETSLRSHDLLNTKDDSIRELYSSVQQRQVRSVIGAKLLPSEPFSTRKTEAIIPKKKVPKRNGAVLLSKTDCSNRDIPNIESILLSKPKCFDKWISNDYSKIKSEFRKYNSIFLNNERKNNSSSSCYSNHLFLTSKSRLFPWFHQPSSFAEAYFGYISAIIWQNRFFGNNYNNQTGWGANECLRSLVVDKTSRLWDLTKQQISVVIPRHELDLRPLITYTNPFRISQSEWISDLISSVDDDLGIKTIKSSSCELLSSKNYLPNNQFEILTERFFHWFLHPSDALLLGSSILNQDPCEWKGKARHLLDSTQLKLTVILPGLESSIYDYNKFNGEFKRVSKKVNS